MKYGIIFDNRKRHPLDKAVRLARLQFEQTEHTQEFEPTEIHFNPADFPQLEGLVFMADPNVKPGYLRLCTQEMGADEELDLSMSYVDSQVQAQASAMLGN